MSFASDANNLVANDTNGQRDVFVADVVTRSLTRESVGWKNGAPTAAITVTPTQGDTNTLFSATLSGSDPDGDAISYSIDWGDGATTSSQSGTHRYTVAGDYVVTGSAFDQFGGTTSVSKTVRVCAATVAGACATPSVADDAQGVVEDAAPGPASALYTGYSAFNTPSCPGQWQSATTGSCMHPDFNDGLDDSYEPLDAQYLADSAATVPPFCQEQGNANQFRVLYLHVRSQTSRFDTLRDDMRQKAKRADYYLWKSARQNGASRHFRYDCGDNNKIRVTEVRLLNSANDNRDATFAAIRLWSGYSLSNKYLAFADWSDSANDPGDTRVACGWGEQFSDDTPGRTNANNGGDRIALVYLRPDTCFAKAGHVAHHELGHTLGAVQQSAPHHSGGHASDQNDAMGVGNSILPGCSDLLFQNRYDCKDDDYFNADPTFPARNTYLADKQEYESGVCQTVRDGDVMRATKCHWNTVWNQFLIGGG